MDVALLNVPVPLGALEGVVALLPRRVPRERDEAVCHQWVRIVEAHHMRYRSAGGSDDLDNQISLCAAHHLHGVHMGWIKVDRVGPDRIRWQLGVRPGFEPIVDVIVPEEVDSGPPASGSFV